MKVLAINGSPRKEWNTATLLGHALEGAASQRAETELLHLCDMDFKGCTSCFACKLKGGKSYGKCAVNDALTPVLESCGAADALILGSPNYIGMPSALMKAFIERLVFPYVVYEQNMSSLYGKEKPTGFIYAMSSKEEWMRQAGYDWAPQYIEKALGLIFGAAESLVVNDTYQFDDYAKYVSSRFDPAQKAKRREEVFPEDCRKAYELGARLARQVREAQEKPQK